MDNPSSESDYIWTPWGWLRLRGWTHTSVTSTPGTGLSIQVPGISVTIQHS